jgi:hypothetical protein
MGMKETGNIKTCFVSAPRGIPLDVLRESLLAHGIRPLVPQELAPGTDWASELQRELVQADLVVGILPTRRQSAWTLFELGQAWALKRRILVIAPPGSEPLPSTLQRLLVLRIAPDNRQAIDFALEQLLSAPPEPPFREEAKIPYEPTVLGVHADALLNTLAQLVQSGSGLDFEKLVADAIRGSGTDVVVESPERDRGADLAVWSDVLEPFVGNPLLVEVKLKIRTKARAGEVFRQLSSYLGASDIRWALLVYADGPPPEDRFWRACPPNILFTPARALFEGLRTRTFPEIVRDLRNRRVHSVGP